MHNNGMPVVVGITARSKKRIQLGASCRREILGIVNVSLGVQRGFASIDGDHVPELR